MGERRRVLIMGAAGRDFHNFNTVYRDDPGTEVVAFTATQIPGIAGRRYPSVLAGSLYPGGIPIYPEEDLERIILSERVDRCCGWCQPLCGQSMRRMSRPRQRRTPHRP